MVDDIVGAPSSPGRGWSARLALWMAILILANVMVDTVIAAPLMVLPQMLEHFGTDQAALLNASAMLAAAVWAPLLGKSADIYGKRRMLVLTLLTAGAGALVCLIAPNVAVFLLGRFLQGAAVAVVFISVALTRQICPPRVAMTAVGVVTSGSSVVGVVSPFLLGLVIDRFGYQSVFILSAVLASVVALCVRLLIPESPIRVSGRIDVRGALLLGGGLAAVLGYVSFGQDLGWLSGGMLVLLVAGAVALAGWVVVALRVTEPIVDIRILNRPLVLTLLAVVLGGGAYQGVLQLKSLIAQVPPDLGLGYGLGAGHTVGALFAAPSFGVMVGGTFAGWLATRIGPAWTLLGGVTLGTLATFAMVVGVSVLPVAITCGALLGLSAGTILTSGFNLVTNLAPPERHSVASGLVGIMIAVGSVVFNVAGASVLKATTTTVDGAPVNSATGVHLYVLMAGMTFIAAVTVAVTLVRNRRAALAAGAALPPSPL